ncbi:uncharacterized protein si:ch73-248e21.7 [Danio aesculapii]|uniref:uncharacterized protein si:ch73-248e21.7 n=1 Tax=Danio aesculapii TaxID=1142201 RepID=UPI0024BFDE73|nr:uncharacterized protein si:ch73-248e21.7 [Danio aesculapii]
MLSAFSITFTSLKSGSSRKTEAQLSTYFIQASTLSDFPPSVHIMGLILRNLLLFLVLGPCFMSTGAQEFTATDENITTSLPNNVTVEDTTVLSSFYHFTDETISSAPVDPVTDVQTEPVTYDLQTTLASTTGTMQDTTTMNTTPLDPVIEETTPESASETMATAQIQQTTMTSTTLPVFIETSMTEQKTPEATTTSQFETTVAFNVPMLTSPSERPMDFITTGALAMTTSDSTEDPKTTTNMTEPSTDGTTIILFDSVDTSMTTSTETPTSTSQLTESDAITIEVLNNNTVSEVFMPVTSGVNVEQSTFHEETNWLLIIIVCAIVACVLCVIVILFIQQRKKKASQTFGPAYMNGQSKRSKKKKGEVDDGWAGPVNLEAGADCDADVQEALLHNDEKKDGDDVVLSTFATLDEDAMSDGGVGGEGTKEAKKWEEQEPMPFIDEDVDENKAGKTLSGNESSKGDGKSEENMNGGETFCLTTAV